MCEERMHILEEKIETLEDEKDNLADRLKDIDSYLKTLHYTISTLMSVSFSNQQVVYNTVLGLSCNFVSANKGVLLLFKEENRLFVSAVKNMPNNFINQVFSSEDNLFHTAIKKKKIVCVEDKEYTGINLTEFTLPCLIVPLIFENEIIGVISIWEKAGKEKFNDEDLKFLTAFSTMAASTINNAKLLEEIKEKERLEQEMKIARHIQTALLPDVPEIDGFDISAMMNPAEEVGGDFYDFVLGKDGKFWLAIGDVSSHGVTPGLIMMMAQSIFSTIVRQGVHLTPREAIIGINDVLYSNIRERLRDDDYMTLVVLSYDDKGTFTFAGAHESILIYRAKTGQCEVIPTPGLWVGMTKELIANTENSTFNLEKNDILLLYTDGLIQGKNEESEQFDMERLKDCLIKHSNFSAEEIKENINKEVSSWVLEQEDDMTMIVIKKIKGSVKNKMKGNEEF